MTTNSPITERSIFEGMFEGKKSLEEVITAFEVVLQDLHDASEHPYQPISSEMKVCATCGWIHPEQEAECGHHSMREHAQQLLDQLKAIKSGDASPSGVVVIEIEVVFVPRRRGFWPW